MCKYMGFRSIEARSPEHPYKSGEIVPVLQHRNCSGLAGVVQNNLDILCQKCGKKVFPDNRAYQQQRRDSRR